MKLGLLRNDEQDQMDMEMENVAAQTGSAKATNQHSYQELVEDPIQYALKMVIPDSTKLGENMKHLNKDVVLGNLTVNDIVLHRELLDLARECDDFGFHKVSKVLRESFAENILQSMAKGGLTTRLVHSNNSNIKVSSSREKLKKGLFG